jgi:transcriptional regulator with XRE-family HTH domain|tara:strand:+ start:631 stop:1065 length:435 start_codon:yes stop_codon:yes gene_type:complete
MATVKNFGKQLKALRKKASLTQPELAKASKVATSIVNDIENGIRTAGCKTLNKIATGLGMPDDERFLFLLAGLAFSKRDFVIPDFSEYSPELLNYLPYVLQRSGIKAANIKQIDLPNQERKNLQITLKSKQKIALEIRLAPLKK